MWTHDTGFASSLPPRVTIEISLGKKATENHLIKSTSLEKLRAPSPVSATLQIEYATQFFILGLNQRSCLNDFSAGKFIILSGNLCLLG